MITLDGLVESTKAIKDLLDKFTYELNGQEIEKPFYTLDAKGNKITALIYFDETEQGIPQNFKIYSKSGKVFYATNEFIEKEDEESFICGFIMTVNANKVDMDEELLNHLKETLK